MNTLRETITKQRRDYRVLDTGMSYAQEGGAAKQPTSILDLQTQLLKAVIDELPSVWHYTNKASNAEKVVARFHNDEINLLKEKLEQAL